jgi:hypothetical protein
MSTSRWLTWTSKGAVTKEMPEPASPKPPKVTFEGFAGITPGLFPIAECSIAELDTATSQIFRWIRARCVRRRDLWGSEKSLWCDYIDWRQQHKISVVQRERFAEILDQSFRREMDGWRGIALAVDVAPTGRYIM